MPRGTDSPPRIGNGRINTSLFKSADSLLTCHPRREIQRKGKNLKITEKETEYIAQWKEKSLLEGSRQNQKILSTAHKTPKCFHLIIALYPQQKIPESISIRKTKKHHY
uniref:Uncharacterized protein n=1 Tax=Opuntia streptacantha TaxID=393608 RepID=A0A7C9E1U2_OPUST